MNNTNIIETLKEDTNIISNTMYEKDFHKLKLYQKILKVFNTKNGTLIVFAEGFALGNAFKDLISSLILNIIIPITSYILKFCKITNAQILMKTKNHDLNIYLFINNLSIFIMLCLIIYYINLSLTIY